MNIKLPLTALLLAVMLHAPVFAQSGTIHFRGRIVAPVCSGTLTAAAVQPAVFNAKPEQIAMDNSGCEHNIGLIASTRLTRNNAPALPLLMQTGDPGNVAGAMEPVLTITYH